MLAFSSSVGWLGSSARGLARTIRKHRWSWRQLMHKLGALLLVEAMVFSNAAALASGPGISLSRKYGAVSMEPLTVLAGAHTGAEISKTDSFVRPVPSFAASLGKIGVVSPAMMFQSTPPGISGLQPNSAGPGATITITGQHFGTTQGTGKVTFNGATATIVSWSDTSIQAKVPTGGTSGNVVVASASNGSSGGAPFKVINPTGVSVDQVVSGGSSIGGFSTNAGNELVLAFVAAAPGAVGSNGTVSSISGGGLTWTMVKRTNGQTGTAEIWRAFAASVLNKITVTANLPEDDVSMTLISFMGMDTSGTNGSGAIGATGTHSATSGGPTVSLTTTRNNSLVFAVGEDYKTATARTPTSNQTIVSQQTISCTTNFPFTCPTTGDTLWVQQLNTAVTPSSTAVNVTDTAPTGDPYNYSAVEILPASTPASSPVITSLSAISGAPGTSITITGTNFGSTTGSVSFNGTAATPSSWSSTSVVVPVPSGATTGNVTLTAASQTSNGLRFIVAYPGGLAIDQVALGGVTFGSIGGATLTTASGNEVLLLLVGTAPNMLSDPPPSSVISPPQGGGLTWVQVEVAQTQTGTAEVWRAFSPYILNNVSINYSPGAGATDVSMTLVALLGADTTGSNGSGAIGAIATSNSASGAPSAALTTTRANSLVFGVGDDPTAGVSRTLGANQTKLAEDVKNNCSGSICSPGSYTLWSQQLTNSITNSGTRVTLNDTAPSNDAYNLSILEVLPPAGATPAITSLSPISGPVGTVVTITGTNFGNSQGTSTVTFAGVTATPTTWTNTSIVVPVPQSVSLGAAAVVVTVTGVGSSNSATFTVVAPLAITASVSPAPNAAGWNKANVTISYTCTGGVTPVQCPSSRSVTTEGANQSFTATATDANNNQASVTTSLNIDKTAPALAITSPANNSTVITPTLPVSGTVSDALSGISTVTCNGAVATVQSGTFSCSVTLAAGANTVTVSASDIAGNTSTQSISVTLGPSITDFTPKTGPVGTAVSIQGNNLVVPPNLSTVTFTGSTGPVTAHINFSSATQIAVNVPTGAITGPITVANSAGSASTTVPFTVGPRQDFQVTASPGTGTVPQGSLTSFAIAVTSQQTSFTQLAQLSVTGAPAGVSATFSPTQITAGATSSLRVDLGAANLQTGSYSFLVHAAATVDGVLQDRTASVVLNVTAAGPTTLAGQVVSTSNQPIVGATVSLDGLSVLTDGAGRFLLSGVQPGTHRSLSIDGHSASSPNATFPLIFEPVNVLAGRANVVSNAFHLPPIDTSQEVTINPNADTVAGNASVPNLQMTIPQGAHLRMLDGTLVTRTSITPLAPDRTPAPLPSDVGTNIVYTSQPGGAITDIPIPVVYPNLAGLNPGTEVELYAFDHAHVNWFVYGKGMVSTDGRTINPEINPATGKPYGLPDFSWHFPNTGPNGNPASCDGSPSCYGPNPVDYSTGMKIENVQQVSWGGARGGLDFSLIYTTDKTQNCDGCPFGRGWTHNWDFQISGSFAPGGAGRLIAPGQVAGKLFSSSGTDSSGNPRFTSTVTSSYLGASMLVRPSGTQFVDRHGTTWNFNSSGRLTSKVDTNGNTTTLTYSSGLLRQITDPVGRSLTFAYDGSNRIISMTDSIGQTWHYTYEGTPGVAGVPGLTTFTDPAGNVTRYSYVTGGRIASVTDPRGNVAKQITYDLNGRVASQTFADGGTETYSYQLAGTIVTNTVVTDPSGNTMSKRFDANGYVIGATDEVGQTTTFTRDLTTSQPRFSIAACNCAQTASIHDTTGNLSRRTDRLGNQTSWSFDPTFNQVTLYVDKLGNKTTYGYDAKGNLIAKIDALSGQETYDQDQFGQLTTITDALGHSAHFEYDSLGNLTALTDALGNRSTATYDGIGRITSRVDALSRTSTYSYDLVNKIVSSVDPAGGTTAYTYDANGNATIIKDALGNSWTMSYDAKNRLASKTDPLGHTTHYKYDLNDRAIAVISPENRIRSMTYDSRGLIATRADPSGAVTTYGYDNQGHLTSIKDPRGNTRTYTYDLLGHMVASSDPLGKQTTDSYDAQGNRILHVDRLGRSTTFKYDALNRISSVLFPDSTITYSYDAASRPVRIDDSESGSIQWVYDDANRLISAVQPAGTVTYSYNAAGQRTSMTVEGRQPVTYAYDSAGRVSTISQGTDVFTYTYDAASDMVSLQRPNGVPTTYSLDASKSLIETQHGSAGAVEDFHYSYTPDSFIASISSMASAPILPVSTTIGVADPANRIPTEGSDSLTYDGEGQSAGKSNSQGSTQYIWDARGRLTQVILPNSQSVAYTYDPLGRRISRTANGVTSQFLYDGAEVVLDENSDGSTVEYLNGTGIDKKLRMLSSSNGALYFLRDHLGSTVALVGSTGAVVERIQYDAYGASTGSAFTRYLYAGREFDSDTGLIFYRARYYDPKLGRFITEDRSGPAGGSNFYAYCNGNPIQCVDPSGLQGEPPEVPEVPEKPEGENAEKDPRDTNEEDLAEMLRKKAEDDEEAFREKEEDFYKRHPEGPQKDVCYVDPEDDEFAKLLEAIQRFSDPFGESTRRYRILATQPGKRPTYRITEEVAARQFEAQTGMKLTRSSDNSYDWTTPIGGRLATVDAVGPLPKPEYYNEADFFNSIQGHLNKQGLDFIPVSTVGLTPEQTSQVLAYINGLPPAAQARIIFLGSH